MPPRTERTLRPLHEKAEEQGEVPGEGGSRSRRAGGEGAVQVRAEEEEVRSRPGGLPVNRSMAIGPPTVSQTRPAKTTTTAAGPRWTLASVELATEEGRGG